MATDYDQIEDRIKTALEVAGTPLERVFTYGAQLSNAELAEELNKFVSYGPSAMVLYEGGTTNEGFGGQLTEDGQFSVLVVVPGKTAAAALRGDAAASGVYALLQWVRQKLHNVAGFAPNPLIWQRTSRLALPGERLTVAAYAMTFKAMLVFTDGPG